MSDAGKLRRMPTWLERANVRRRFGPHNRQEPFDRLQHVGDPAERQRRRAKTDHFAILSPLIAANDLNRIGRRLGIVEGRVQRIEGWFQQRQFV